MGEDQNISEAILDNKFELIQEMISNGYPIDGSDSKKWQGKEKGFTKGAPYWTPLIAAAYKGNIQIVKLLIDAGAPIDSVNYRTETAFIEASKNEHLEVAKALVKAGANIHHTQCYGKNAVEVFLNTIPATNNSIKVLQYLVDLGISTENCLEYFKELPFLLKSMNKKENNEINQRFHLLTIINENWSGDRTKIDKLIQECELSKTEGEKSAKTVTPSKSEKIEQVQIRVLALFRGIYGLDWPDEKILEADPGDFETDPSLFYELLEEEFQLKVNDEPDSDLGGIIKETIEFIAARWDGIHSDKSAINIQDGMGVSLLHLACQDDEVNKVKQLIISGADVNITDGNGLTPVHIAIQYSNKNVLRYLIESGADITFKDPQYEGNYLHHAIQKPDYEILITLIEAGVPINEKDIGGWSPLWFALGTKNMELIEFLLKNGADPNIKNPKGITPLKVSRDEGEDKIFSLLIQYGGLP